MQYACFASPNEQCKLKASAYNIALNEVYALKPVTDPIGRGKKVIARGGSWRNNMNGNRVTERAHYEPNKADDFIGFRVAMAPVLPE